MQGTVNPRGGGGVSQSENVHSDDINDKFTYILVDRERNTDPGL